MKSILIAYFATLAVFVSIDFIWLSLMADILYRPLLGDLLAVDFRLAPAIAFYVIYAGGLTYLAVRPALLARDGQKAAMCGLVMGLVAYGTYDLTNQSVLRSWPPLLTVVDMSWGVCLSCLSAVCGYRAGRSIIS